MSLDNWNNRMDKANAALNKCMPFLTPTGVVLGVLLGSHVSWMKPAVNILFGILTFSGALSISPKDLFDTIRRPRFIFLYFVSTLLLMPSFTYFVTRLCFSSNLDLCSGFIAVRAMPTAVVGTIWTSIYSGNMAIAISIITLDTILAPLVAPTLIRLLTQTSAPIDASGMVKSLFIMVVLPSILGMVVNKLRGGSIRRMIHPTLKPLGKVFLPVLIMINCSVVSERLIAGFSPIYFALALFAFLLSVFGYGVGYSLSKAFRLNKEDATAMTFAIALRNTSASLVIAVGFMPPDAALPAIFSIMFQQIAASLVGGYLFGKDK